MLVNFSSASVCLYSIVHRVKGWCLIVIHAPCNFLNLWCKLALKLDVIQIFPVALFVQCTQTIFQFCEFFFIFSNVWEFLFTFTWDHITYGNEKFKMAVFLQFCIFSSAWLCQQSSRNRNLSVVCRPSVVRPSVRVAIISEPNARISFKF